MRKLGLSVLLAWAAFAQEKPVTLDALDESLRSDVQRAAAWAPDGQAFARWEQGGIPPGLGPLHGRCPKQEGDPAARPGISGLFA